MLSEGGLLNFVAFSVIILLFFFYARRQIDKDQFFVFLAVVGILTQGLMKPYHAQKEVSGQVGFFDERLLDPAKSINDLERLAKLHPYEPALLEKLAYFYSKEIKTKKKKINAVMAQNAITTYQQLIQVDPNKVAAYNNLANVYYTIGQKESAIKTWKKAVREHPTFLDGHLNLGKVLYVDGKLKESAAHFETVLRLDPNNSEALIFLKRMVE